MNSDQDLFRPKPSDKVPRASDTLMTDEPKPVPTAWHPLTPRSIARFAAASTFHLFIVQLVFACIVAGSIIWFLATNFSPVISRILQQMPEEAKIAQGTMTGVEPGLLANGKFLSILIGLEPSSEGGTADLQMKLRENTVDVCSLLGCVSLPYPAGTISLGRSVSDPWWGAWKPAILAGIGAAFIIFLIVSWGFLAFIYLWPVRLLAYFTDKQISMKGTWRLSCAAQLPGALFMAVGIVLYGLQAIDLVRFLIFWGLHFVISWIYIFISPFFLEQIAAGAALKSNPFTEADKEKI